MHVRWSIISLFGIAACANVVGGTDSEDNVVAEAANDSDFEQEELNFERNCWPGKPANLRHLAQLRHLDGAEGTGGLHGCSLVWTVPLLSPVRCESSMQ